MKTSENLKLYYSVFSLTVLILAFSLGEILSKYGVFLVGIFPVLSPNTRKTETKKLLIWTLFTVFFYAIVNILVMVRGLFRTLVKHLRWRVLQKQLTANYFTAKPVNYFCKMILLRCLTRF